MLRSMRVTSAPVWRARAKPDAKTAGPYTRAVLPRREISAYTTT
jgi:hypothetical protein